MCNLHIFLIVVKILYIWQYIRVYWKDNHHSVKNNDSFHDVPSKVEELTMKNKGNIIFDPGPPHTKIPNFMQILRKTIKRFLKY